MKAHQLYGRARTLLRKVVANTLYYSGMLWVYASIKLHRRVVVLMYHRVLPTGADTYSEEGIIVTPETFKRHLSFLKRYFRPLSLAQLIEALTAGSTTSFARMLDHVRRRLARQRRPRPAATATATDASGRISGNRLYRERNLLLAGAVGAPHVPGGGARGSRA